MRRVATLSALLVSGVLVPTGFAGPAERTVAVRAQEYRFTPVTISGRVGQRLKVVVTNAGTVNHEFVSPIFKDAEDAEVVSQGVKVGGNLDEVEFARGKVVTIEFTPKKAGTYQFWCAETVGGKLHRDLGMKGTIAITK